ncbi:MAG: GNAT family N-acetyltransferase, partial [Rubrobacteraceae bacterium]
TVYRWFEDHPLADQVYRWVAVTEDGEVVGHLSALPLYYWVNGQRVVAHTPGDYMVDPRYGFYALSLMRKFFRTCENCVACDMVPATITVETRLGAEVAGELGYAAKLLNVGRLPVPSLPGPVARALNLQERELPVPQGYLNNQGEVVRADGSEGIEGEEVPVARPRLPLPEPVKNLLNGSLEKIDDALYSRFGNDLQVEPIESFDESFDELFEEVAAAVPATVERNAEYLRWRYGPGCPQHPVTVYGVKEGEKLLGYAVLKVPTGGIDGYILDLSVLPGRQDVARALLRETIRYFRKVGAQIVRYRYQESLTSARSGDLRRLGFFFRSGRSNKLLTKFADKGQHKMARHVSNWAYTVGDGEAAFWMR